VTKRAVQKVNVPRAKAGRRRTAAKATRVTARKVAGFAIEKKAEDVRVMDLRKVTDVTSFFIICTGNSNSQVKAIVESVLDGCKKAGIEVYNVEGYESLRWVLVDLIDIVVHVFQPEVRGYYQLERLWGDAPVEKIGDDESEAVS
jgi:ribosome-associated protein